MSLRDEDRASLVKLEIEKAERTFKENEGLVEKGYWSTLANRLYYALFHAVSALLIYDHHEVGSHKGAAIRFHQYYVHTGLFSVDDGAFYSQIGCSICCTQKTARSHLVFVGAGPVPARCPRKGHFLRIKQRRMWYGWLTADMALSGHRAGTGPAPTPSEYLQIMGTTY